MLCANQQMIAQVWPFLEKEKPLLVDWLPWSHTFGSNHNLNMVLRNGGTLYIDEGRPAPGLIEKTARNLREVRPNLLFNVPRGLDMLLPLLEADRALARDVFSRLRALFYAAAALTPSTWKRLEVLAQQVREEPLWLTTSWGSTETAPAVTSAHWRLEGPGSLGIPLPGLELKLVPNGQKQELRVRGVCVFPGYLNAPELTSAAFDEEGFYKIGDAGYLADEAHPERGVIFNGRVAEDFKLSSGTWVSVGTLRVKLVSAFAPYAQDVVITGHDRDEVCAMLFPSAACAQISPEALTARLREALAALRAEGGGSSQCPARILVLTEPPNADAGEITDKGYVNQGAVLGRRAAEVELLYQQPPPARVICAPEAERAAWGDVE
jgi:feruloyl-CoA synthase